MSDPICPKVVSHFEIHQLLGRGGQGEVYRAVDRHLNRVIAIKLLQRDAATGNPFEELLKEARRQATINHPNLPTVYEVGCWEGQCYLAMEYVRGESLDQRLTGGPLEIRTALSIAAQVLSALQAIHDNGLIHGDLSSANVILMPGDGIKLLDLGLAEPVPACGSDIESATVPACPNDQLLSNGPSAGFAKAGLSGTIPCLAPEVIRKEGQDRRSDYFALGVLLYEMVTGHHPFKRTDVAETIRAILQEEPPLLSRSRPDTPLELERIVRRALAKQPVDRYSSGSCFQADLETLARRLETGPFRPAPRHAAPPHQSIPGIPVLTAGSRPAMAAWILRRRWLLFISSVTAAFTAAAGWVFGHPFGAEWLVILLLLILAGIGLAGSALVRCGPPPKSMSVSAAGAFQGLQPFLERDRDRFFGRHAETEALVKMVMSPDVRFAVLVGESGCGKTSLLRAALLPRLWEAGQLPIYCRAFIDPLSAIGAEAQRQSQIAQLPNEPLGDYLRRLSQILQTTLIIICDQFEEFFVNFPADAEREPFLSFVAETSADPLARIAFLLAVRGDFFHLVSAVFSERVTDPLASRQVFHLRNFTEDQAEAVFRLTAAQAELPLESGFSAYLARDLAAGRSVRPSELQIVGEQLQNLRILTVADYRRAGGKEQLVNGFLTDVIQLSGTPAKAARVLHALISEEDTRLTLPLAEISSRAQLDRETVDKLLQLFVRGRLVGEIREECPYRYELVHEYLIGPIHRATGSVMDERHRADRLLRQYLANYQVDPKTRVPLGKLFLLHRFSDLARRGTGAELMRKSAWRAGWQACLAGILAAMAALALAAWMSVSESWQGMTLRDGHSAAALQAVFAPDGTRLVTSSEDGTVIVWDFPRRRRLATFRDHPTGVWSVAFSPDGQFLATGGHDGLVVIRNGRSLKKTTSLPGTDWINHLAFVPTRRLLLVLGKQTITMWSTTDWSKIQEYPLGNLYYGNCCLTRSDRILYCNRAFSLNGDGLTDSVDGHSQDDLRHWGDWNALSPDGDRLASIDSHGVVRCWEIGSTHRLLEKRIHHDHGRTVAFSPNGRWLASGAENIVLWDADTLSMICRLDYPALVWNLAFSSDSRWLISTHGDGAVLVWDLRERALAARLDQHSGPIRAVAFSPDGRRVASTGDDHSIIIWNVAGTPRKLETLQGHATRVNGLAFSPDGTWLVSADQMGKALRWNLDPPRRPVLLFAEPSNSPLYNMVVIDGGRSIVTGNLILDSTSGRPIVAIRSVGHSYTHDYAYSWNAAAHLLVGIGPMPIPCASLWELDIRQDPVFDKSTDPNSPGVCVSLAPDARTLVTGNDAGNLWLWQTRPLRRLALLGKHAARVKAVAFSPDGRHVASGGDDCTIRLWDTHRRREITQIGTHTTPVLALAFSPDGTRLVSGEYDHTVRLHTLRRTLWGLALD